MKWKESNKDEAESIWNTLAGVNLQIYKEFQQLNSFYEVLIFCKNINIVN